MSFANSIASGRAGSRVAYWIVTILLATECIVGGVMASLRMEPFFGIIRHLGYPVYFMNILGTWYALAGIALLAPRSPLLKEWAYAGLIFNYIGAVASHLAVGDGVVSLVGPVIFIGLVIVSWALRPPARRLPAVDEKMSSGVARESKQ